MMVSVEDLPKRAQKVLSVLTTRWLDMNTIQKKCEKIHMDLTGHGYRRILKTLVEQGLVERKDQDEKYASGKWIPSVFWRLKK